MKKITLILPLLLAGTIVSQSYSFTSAQIEQSTSVSIVPEESALIAVSYSKNARFTLTNNTDKTIEVTDINIRGNGSIAHDSLEIDNRIIMPGESKNYRIEGLVNELEGTPLEIFIHFENGEIAIKSTLPEFNVKEKSPKKSKTEENLDTNNNMEKQKETTNSEEKKQTPEETSQEKKEEEEEHSIPKTEIPSESNENSDLQDQPKNEEQEMNTTNNEEQDETENPSQDVANDQQVPDTTDQLETTTDDSTTEVLPNE